MVNVNWVSKKKIFFKEHTIFKNKLVFYCRTKNKKRHINEKISSENKYVIFL